jgi:hypothetical protein
MDQINCWSGHVTILTSNFQERSYSLTCWIPLLSRRKLLIFGEQCSNIVFQQWSFFRLFFKINRLKSSDALITFDSRDFSLAYVDRRGPLILDFPFYFLLL